MIRSTHNLYVSTPNWFTTPTQGELTNSTQPILFIPTSSGGTQINSNITEEAITDFSIGIYNRSLHSSAVLSTLDLTAKGQAVSILKDTLGELISDVEWASTKYTEVISGSQLKFTTSYDSSAKYGIVFYDLGYNAISGKETSTTIQTINVPYAARYFKICARNNDLNFDVQYVKPTAYTPNILQNIYNGSIDDYTHLKFLNERINHYIDTVKGISFVADAPLKLEIDKNNNLHFNINDMFSAGSFVTTTSEQQQVTGVKTFENGIGIGDYMIIPDVDNESLKVVHKDSSKLGNLYTTGWLSAKGISSNNSTGSATALYQLVDVLNNTDGNGVQGAVIGSVLKYDGTHWYGAEDSGFDLNALQTYLTNHKYLTESQADDLFLTPEEGDALFLTEEEGDARYLLKSVFAKLFTAYDADGNVVDITVEDSIIDNISVNYNFWSTGYVSALGKQDGGTSSGSASALYQLIDILSDGNKVLGAEEGCVLKYDGTHWYADKISFDDENFATIDWVLQQNYVNSNRIDLLEAEVDTKWTQDDLKIANWDDTYIKLNDWFYKDSDGYIHARYGFVGDSFVSALGVSNESAGGSGSIVYDGLDSTETQVALSANMGRELKEMIDDTNTTFGDYYDKAAVNALISNVEVDLSDYYTQGQVNELVGATSQALNTHINNSTIHITSNERTKWNDTYTKLNNYFYVDSNGYIHARYGFVGDSFVSAQGVSDDPSSGGGGGITEVYWDDIINRPTKLSLFTDDVVINKYLPITGGTITGSLTTRAVAPSANNTYLLGYSNYQWAAGYFAKLYVDGNTVLDSSNYSSYALPLTGGSMANTKLVTNLNADMLDGAHLSKIMHQGSENEFDDSQGDLIIPIANPTDDTTLSGKYGAILQWCSNYGEKPSSTNTYNWYYQLAGRTTSANLLYRRRTNGGSWTEWETIAFTTSNVASATRLETPRTIWGQSFDGTKNVSGALSGATTGTFSDYVSAKSLKVNGGNLTYDSSGYWKLEGDLLVTGGVTMFADEGTYTPSVIMDGVLYDDVTIGRNSSGQLYVKGGSGGMDTSELAAYLLANKYTNSITTTGSGNAITSVSLSGSKLTFTKGATYLTAHQTIYNLTLQAGTFSAETFDPNGAAKTINIPTTTAHIAEGTNLYFTNARALAAITGGASTIKSTNLTTSRALVSDANGKVAVSAVTSTELGYLDGVTSAIQTQLNNKAAKSTTLSGYGITNAYTKTEADAKYLPLSGNATSATKLETARTIWGQLFNGTANVSGAMSGVTTLNASGAVTFGSTLSVGGNSTFTGLTTHNGGLQIANDSMLYIKWGKVVYANQQVMYGVNTNGDTESCLYPRWSNGTYLNYGTAGFFIRNNASTNTMIMTDDNMVGIGVTPTYKLHVNGTFRASDAASLGSTLSVTGASTFTGKTTHNGGLASTTGSFSSTVSMSSTLAVKTGITIGGTSANNGTYALHLTGSAYISSNLLMGGGVTMHSQRSLKNIMDERGLSLAELSAIKPIRYTWKDKRDDRLHIGGIADDILKVMPEVVYKVDGTLTMDYSCAGFAIAASLIKPVSEHERRIAALECENMELRKEIEQLKSA